VNAIFRLQLWLGPKLPLKPQVPPGPIRKSAVFKVILKLRENKLLGFSIKWIWGALIVPTA
jgi:hypothetical protein